MEIDEKILTLRQEVKEAKALGEREARENANLEREIAQSIYDERVEIFGQPTVFAERNLLDDKISMRLPVDFEPLDEESVKLMYRFGNPPPLVMSNEPLRFTLGFNDTEHRVADNQLKEFVEVAQLMLERVGPKVSILEKDMIDCGPDRVALLAMVSQTLDAPLYNIMFYVSINGRLVMGFINFKYEDHKRLAPLAKEIIGSLRVLAEEEGES